MKNFPYQTTCHHDHHPSCRGATTTTNMMLAEAAERKNRRIQHEQKNSNAVLGSCDTPFSSSPSSLRLWVAIALVGIHLGNGFVINHTRRPLPSSRHWNDEERRQRPTTMSSRVIHQAQHQRGFLLKVIPSLLMEHEPRSKKSKFRAKQQRGAGTTGGGVAGEKTLPFVPHEILSQEDERRLTMQIAKAKQVQETLSELLLWKKKKQQYSRQQQDDDGDDKEEEEEEESFLTDDEFYAKHYVRRGGAAGPAEVPLKYQLLERHYQQSMLERSTNDDNWQWDELDDNDDNDDDFSSSSPKDAPRRRRQNNIFLWPTSADDAAAVTGTNKKTVGVPELTFFDSSSNTVFGSSSGGEAEEEKKSRGYDLDTLLHDDDIINDVGLPGGRTELWAVLRDGALARDELIRSNLRLVSSIALQYCHKASMWKGTSRKFAPSIYVDGWDRPSINEAFQDGVLGLITAVERFEPARGLRFSTYATYWITNYVRRSFQVASTGALRLPANLYNKKSRYYALVRSYIARGESPPPFAQIAASLRVSAVRLRTILRVTRPPRSTDEEIPTSDAFVKKGITVGDTIPDDSPTAEDLVDLSFLRQSLESLMAGVLAPHERDILRLRLGLDDGVDRSVRDVVNVYNGQMTKSEIMTTEQTALQKLRVPMILARYRLDASLYNE
jgi:RNA polymerase primary sigma factor